MSDGLLKKLAKLRDAVRRQMSMPSSYQGSTTRYLLGRMGFSLRQMVKRRRALRSHLDGKLTERLAAYEQLIAKQDWNSVLPAALEIADIAEEKRDADLLTEMSAALGRLAAYERSTEIELKAWHLRQGKRNDEWKGEDISGKALLIELTENSKQSLGRVIRYAQMIATALPRARRCIVLVEARLVPIFRRSFPSADIRADSKNNDAARAEAGKFASFAQLASIFAHNADEIRKNFVPLKADTDLVREFRASYLKAGPRPLVGLSWGSKSYNKDVPDLREWSQFIREEPAQFVSLQYGKVFADLPRLTGNKPDRVIYDPSVDQLKDMDRFAAQIAALDAVISISNTAAHLAGALGVPAIYLIDDRFHTDWPVFGDTVPWYPRGQVVLKLGRDWPAVLREAQKRLESILEKPRKH